MEQRLLNNKTILVIIPSYEDPSLIATIQGAIDKATYPERIYFAVGLQHQRINLDLSIYNNLTIIDYGPERPGLIQVRNDLASLSTNYDYVLSIDAHMTFTSGWDVFILDDYNELRLKTGNDKVVISCQMSNSEPPVTEPCNCRSDGEVALHHITQFDYSIEPNGELDFLTNASSPLVESPHQDFVRTYYTSMDLFFAPKEYFEHNLFFIEDVKMFNDEPLQSYLIFMRGWEAYRSYKRVYAYHNWNPFKFEKNKQFAAVEDSPEVLYETIRFFLYNLGPYKIDSELSPEDFYKAIGMHDHYMSIVSARKYYQPFSDIIEYLAKQEKNGSNRV